MRTTAELREGFLSYFEAKGHVRHPSGSVIPPAEDRSTLFTVAGMQPLQPYFLGLKEPPAPRLVTAQKVMRAGGKHNDLDDVGRTPRHGSFFEMLGNFSFGDYFKDGAIDLAWEFVTERLGFPRESLWATVFAGDPELGLGEDEVAIAGLGAGRHSEGADRRAAAGRELLAGGRHRAVRAVLGALLRPGGRVRLRPARLRAGLRLRPLPRVLEPRLHGVRPRCRRVADAAPEPEHRHRPRARAECHAPAGRRLDVRHRRLPADHGVGGGGERGRVRSERGGDQSPSRPGRPRAGDDVPDCRRRHAVERGAWLRAAPGNPQGDHPWQPDRARVAVPRAPRGSGDRADGGGLPGARVAS